MWLASGSKPPYWYNAASRQRAKTSGNLLTNDVITKYTFPRNLTLSPVWNRSTAMDSSTCIGEGNVREQRLQRR